MRQSTEVFARLASIGQPHLTQDTGKVPVKQLIVDIAKWLLAAEMGSRIEITIGRDEASIRPRGREVDSLGIGDELTKLLANIEGVD